MQPVLNKLLYRARQRGFLELDLLVGRWAERELAGLQPDVLRDFEVLLDQVRCAAQCTVPPLVWQPTN